MTYYVDINAGPGGDGSQGNPWDAFADATATVVGGFLHSAVATWHPDFPPMSLPSAMVFIIYGIALCILSNGPRNGNGGVT